MFARAVVQVGKAASTIAVSVAIDRATSNITRAQTTPAPNLSPPVNRQAYSPTALNALPMPPT